MSKSKATPSPSKVNWKNITKQVQKLMQGLRRQRIRPSLRHVFYILFQKGLIPNTSNSYKSFGKEMVEAREDGRLPMLCFSDTGRVVVGDSEGDYFTPEELVDDRINELQNTEVDYWDYIQRWQDQKHYVEVWIEKEAMTSTFVSYLEGLGVRIVPNRGNPSLTFLYQNIQRCKQKQREGKTVHILYYGDLDPSGDYAATIDIPNRMKKYGYNPKVNGGSYEVVAVTEEQVRKYNLPYEPDAPTMAKIQEDDKLKYYTMKYDTLYAVELDALPAVIPREFKKLVIRKVNQYYDKKIYQDLMDKYDDEYIREVLKRRIQKLADELNE